VADYAEVGEWSGKTLYGCGFCLFDTPDVAAIKRHVEKAHPRTRAPEVRILGPDGEEVQAIPIRSEPDDYETPKQEDTLVRPDGSNRNDTDDVKAETPWWRRS